MTPLVEVFAPSLGRKVKFGRRAPVAPAPHFRLVNYLHEAMPDPAGACDFSGGASTSAALADVLGNDAIGDCVIAWLLHQLAVWTGGATGGAGAYHATRAEAIAMYAAITGYNPNDPSTDQGTDMSVAIQWVIANGFPNGDRPVGSVRVDAANGKLLRQAIELFEGCGFGVGLPDEYVQSMPSSNGFTWGLAGASNPAHGHAFLGCGYDSSGVLIDTWGLLGRFTWDAIALYAAAASGGEIDILLSQDMIVRASQKSPMGFDWPSLLADFAEMGGSVPPDPPPPAPPGTAVTLAMAQGWVSSQLATAFPLLTRQQAIDHANAALAAGWPSS